MEKILLASDLDRTLIPNGAHPESQGARQVFACVAGHEEFSLCYVSGRSRELMAEAINRWHLPVPHWAITDVGATLWQAQGASWRRVLAWEEDIALDWRGAEGGEIVCLLSQVPGLRPQEERQQGRLKASFYVDPEAEDVVKTIHALLHPRGIRAEVILSFDAAAGVGLADVLPRRANKRHALEFLCQHLGFPKERVVFFGDSGNDLAVFKSDFYSVVVANADEDIKEEARLAAGVSPEPKTPYIAQGGFLGMNGCYAAGVLEGLAAFFPETQGIAERCAGGHLHA